MVPPRYTLRQLSYFVAAARAGSIAGAAAAEQVSRSAVAAAINELEAAFQVSLAARSRGIGFELTATGRQVFDLAISLLRDADELTSRVVRGGLTGSLSIGAMPSHRPTVLPLHYEELAKHHPGLRLDVQSQSQPEILAALHAGELDLAVVYGGHAGHDLDGAAV
ncbi:MAG: LysR family transcriptional regulator, partial [Pseudoclavibacter sp.]